MSSVFIYPVCLLMFALCVGVVMVLHGRNASHNTIVLTGGALGAITFVLQYVPPPFWLMADFEKAYLPAGQAALGDHKALADLLAKGVDGFVNLPVVAFLFTPFSVMQFHVSELAFFGLGGLAGLVLWRELVRLADLKARESALLMFLAIGSGPAGYNLVNGNTSQIVIVLIIWGIMSYMRGRDSMAGILFACAALIKPALIILGIFTLLRGRWRVTASGAAVCVAATLLSILIFGWPMHVVWLEQTILPALDGTIMAHNVQSIGGVVGRAIVGPAHLSDWTPYAVPELAVLLTRILQLLTAAVIVSCLVVLARRKNPVATAPLEFSFVLMIPLLIPNLSWSHYLLWAFLPLALCLRGLPDLKQSSGAQLAALLSAALMAQPVYMWSSSSALVQDIFGRIIVSLPFLGAVILLGLMVRLVFISRDTPPGNPLRDGKFRSTAFVPPLAFPFKKVS